MKKNAFRVLAALAAGSLLLAGCGGGGGGGLTLQKGILSVGMEIGYPPMEYRDADNNPAGFDVEMAKAIAARLGLEAKFVDTGWDGIFAGVEAGKYDCIIAGATITPARLAAHNFSKPYVANTLAMVVREGSGLAVAGPRDLTGLDVAYQEETTADSYMTSLAEGGLAFNPREYEKVMYCFDELKLGRVNVVVTDLLVALDYVAPPDSPFKIVWENEEPDLFGICLKKGNDALTAAIDKALDDLFADGTLLKLSRDIFGGMDLVTKARR
ncbi:MAG: ABC transporter substrate-binding protein [Treponema sp.]|jgi:polar amino acid transport system substrate-binding protein|nr:ABC transporter substrate-binding protein [Treponema sp.]